MCNAMEIEKAVADDVNAARIVQTELKDNGGNDTVALGRPTPPAKDFFVPVSQRGKISKLGDEVDKPILALSPAVEDVVKKNRGRPKKPPLEDNNRDFFVPLSAKEKPRKLGSLEAILSPAPLFSASTNGAVDSEKLIVKPIEDGVSEFFVPVSKRDKSSKELSKDEASKLEKVSSGAEEVARKRGRPRKSALESEGNASTAAENGTVKSEKLMVKPTEDGVSNFFVPVSKREKSSKELSKDEALPLEKTSTGANDVVRKRGRPRKSSLESDGTTSTAAENGVVQSEKPMLKPTKDDVPSFLVPVSKRESPNKDLSKDEASTLQKTTLEKTSTGAEEVVRKRGRPRKSSLESSGNTSTPAENGAVRSENPVLKPPEDDVSDYFVPVSKREKSNMELSKDEASPVEKASTGAEEVVRKRGRPRKSSLESEGNALTVSPSGEADDIHRPKRGRPAKVVLDGPHSVTLPQILQDSGKLKPGRPRKKAIIEDSPLEDVGKSSVPLEGDDISSRQLSYEGQALIGAVAAQNLEQAAGTSLRQTDNLNQVLDKEGKQVAPGSGPADHRLFQATPCDDFFMPFSKRRKRKEELVDKKLDETGNVPSKPKSQKDGQAEKPSFEGVPTVPILQTVLGKEKKSASTGLPPKEAPSSTPAIAVVREDLDLRLEAVIAAQENARLNAGKAPHPFFARKKPSSLKASTPLDEVSTYQVDDLQPGPPMHITQLPEDEKTEFVWPDWKVTSTSCDEHTKLEFSEMERKSCRLMRPSAPSIWTEREHGPNSCSFPTTDSELAGSPAVSGSERSSDGNETTSSLKAVQDILRHMQQTLKRTTEAVGEVAQSPDACADLSLESLRNRLSWYTSRHESLNCAEIVIMSQIQKESDEEALFSTRNLLWTDLYQPRSSTEVCGNFTAVEALNTWLYNWQVKITGQLVRGEDDNKAVKRDRNADYDSDKGWFEGDSDYDSDIGDLDKETGLYNTLLVTGPEGCGKTAAVYACAGEQGFTVIEVNASDCRNGALIKQKFGEAMESHGLGKGSQVGVESPEPANKRGVNTQENSPGQSKQNAALQRKLFAEKKVGSPVKAQQERLITSQDDNQMDSQSKRKTVILFEDVDKHFDEDKGFLTALLQLSKTTKRPIILTSNRYEPLLPPALEKNRVEFDYQTSEELLLHTCLVSIAEGVPCSPLVLERLADSCHNDLRKVMMALQFWGQGKAPVHQPSNSVTSAGLGKIPDHLGDHQLNRHGASNDLSLEHKKSLNLYGSSELSLSAKHGKGCFDHWESDARWLFHLDVHHFILPKVISGSYECPLTLFVGEKISAAVKELEEHMEWVAAKKAEERARAKNAEYESMELTRKALKKEKDALRRMSQSNAKVVEDGGMNSLSPDEDELENPSGERWTCSPVKSLREAKTLARSPMKPKILKARRALVLCDSDDEEQHVHEEPGGGIEAENRSISNVETHLPGLQNMIANSLDSNVDAVSENLEDIDVIHSCSSEVTGIVRRKRLNKKDATLGTGVGNNMVDIYGEAPSLNMERLGVQSGETISKSELVGFEDTPTILAEGDRPLLVADANDRLATELNSAISGGFGTSGSPQIEGQQVIEYFGSSGENQMLPIFVSGVEHHLEDTSIGTGALERPAFVDESKHVNESRLMSNHGLQSCYSDVVQDNKDGLQESEAVVPQGDSSSGLEGSLQTVLESPNQTGVGTSLSTGLDDQKDADGSESSIFEPVQDAWESLRNSQQTPKLLLGQSQTSADVVSSLADLLDIVSASDVISYVQPEEIKDAWRNFHGSFSEAFEGNIGHSSDWDSCQEIASQLVCTGLQLSLPFLPVVNHADHRSPVLSCILDGAKDAPAVGKCMATLFGCRRGPHQSSDLHGMVENLSAKKSFPRHEDRKARLEGVVQAAVFPRGRVSESGFVDYFGCLARMSQLEETRRTAGIAQGRRPRRFEHYLSKLKALSESDISELLKCSILRSS
ncbi:unnamed protein product [Calypogeia fissa]